VSDLKDCETDWPSEVHLQFLSDAIDHIPRFKETTLMRNAFSSVFFFPDVSILVSTVAVNVIVLHCSPSVILRDQHSPYQLSLLFNSRSLTLMSRTPTFMLH
jgi:hypothetical protein